MKLLRVIKTNREVRSQRKVLNFLISANTMWQSAEVKNAIEATDYWLNSKVVEAKTSR